MKLRESIVFLLKYTFLLLTILIFLLCLFGVNYINYAYKLDISRNNVIIFVLTLLCLIIIFIIKKTLFKKIKVKNNRCIFIVAFILFLCQIVLIYCYYFETDWDVLRIIDTAYRLAEKDNVVLKFPNYFSHYPNNIFIMMLFSKIIALSNIVGVGKYSYFIILVVQSVLNNLTGILIYFVLRKISQKQYLAWTGYVFYILLIWISPWVSIPYSDSIGLIFPISILYLYLVLDCKKFFILKIIGIGVLSTIGYFVKPQIIIISIALIIITILYIKKDNYKVGIIVVFTLSLTFIVCITWINIFQKDNRLSINKEYEITYTHFIKMGLNNNTNGGYWHNDVEDSFSKATKMERQEENLNEIKLRVRNYGLLGLLKHQIKKTLTIYNDGTFGWGLEGRFYYKIKENDFKMANHVRNFYYGDGEYYHIFKYITQGTWLLILFLLIGNIFERNLTNKIRVIYLALIGLFLFESIFEARSRYLYIYIPIFIVIATFGLENMYRKILSFSEKNKIDK